MWGSPQPSGPPGTLRAKSNMKQCSRVVDDPLVDIALGACAEQAPWPAERKWERYIGLFHLDGYYVHVPYC